MPSGPRPGARPDIICLPRNSLSNSPGAAQRARGIAQAVTLDSDSDLNHYSPRPSQFKLLPVRVSVSHGPTVTGAARGRPGQAFLVSQCKCHCHVSAVSVRYCQPEPEIPTFSPSLCTLSRLQVEPSRPCSP